MITIEHDVTRAPSPNDLIAPALAIVDQIAAEAAETAAADLKAREFDGYRPLDSKFWSDRERYLSKLGAFYEREIKDQSLAGVAAVLQRCESMSRNWRIRGEQGWHGYRHPEHAALNRFIAEQQALLRRLETELTS